eukprot:gene17839-24223_t
MLGLDPKNSAVGGSGVGAVGDAGVGAVGGPGVGTTSHDDDEEGVDPRNLAEAAARLAKYTTEGEADEAPPLSHQQWADVYKETGPDGLGGLGSEPLLDVMAVPLAGAVQNADVDADAGGESRPALGCTSAPPPTWYVSCGAARLLTCETGAQGLVGLSDDVDCAVMRVGWASVPGRQEQVEASTSGSGGAGPAQVHATGSALTNAAEPSLTHAAGSALTHGQEPSLISAPGHEPALTHGAGPAQAQLHHDCYIPALAYVVAGKLQRKHLLLGDPSGDVGAVLVEGKRFAYIYATTAGLSVQHGQQEVVDMELLEGESILGARLYPRHPLNQCFIIANDTPYLAIGNAEAC